LANSLTFPYKFLHNTVQLTLHVRRLRKTASLKKCKSPIPILPLYHCKKPLTHSTITPCEKPLTHNETPLTHNEEPLARNPLPTARNPFPFPHTTLPLFISDKPLPVSAFLPRLILPYLSSLVRNPFPFPQFSFSFPHSLSRHIGGSTGKGNQPNHHQLGD
jgi:hypothetical protein